MARHIELSDNDRLRLMEIQEALGLSQKQIAEMCGVPQPWLSNMFTGGRTNVNRERFERVVNALLTSINTHPPTSELSDERVQEMVTFLSRFIANASSSTATKINRPGGPVPFDAAYYVKRSQEDQVLEALQDMPFTMMIRGPVQCGKSTLLARLGRRAREIGVEIAWFDPKLPFTLATHEKKQKSDINATAAMALSALLQTEWGLKPPPAREGPTDSITKVTNWLLKQLAATAPRPRLLILDDLASLGGDAAEEWLALFVRAIYNKYSTDDIELSIAIGLSHHFGADFKRKLLFISSVVHWSPYIELGWLEKEEERKAVKELGRKLREITSEGDDLLKYFKGQPFLTHVAATDKDFLDSVRDWTADKNKSEPKARPIRGAQAYRQHLNAIKLSILGPTAEISRGDKALIESFINAVSGQELSDDEQKEFFKRAHLLDEKGNPRLAIYKLIAEDLKEYIER